MKLFNLIFLASLIIVKILLGSIFIYKMEIDPLSLESNAIASEPQKNSEPPVTLTHHQDASPQEKDEKGSNSAIEEQIDLNFLIMKKAEIEKEEKNLGKKRAELLAIQKDITSKIAKLTQLRNEIRAQMATKKTVQEQRLKHLIKAYSAMKPQKAASLIEKLEITFAIELLSEMKGDTVGNILSFIELDKAAKICEKLAKRK